MATTPSSARGVPRAGPHDLGLRCDAASQHPQRPPHPAPRLMTLIRRPLDEAGCQGLDQGKMAEVRNLILFHLGAASSFDQPQSSCPGRAAAHQRVYARLRRAMAKRSGAVLSRDPSQRAGPSCVGPGSAAHRFTLRRARDTRLVARMERSAMRGQGSCCRVESNAALPGFFIAMQHGHDTHDFMMFFQIYGFFRLTPP